MAQPLVVEDDERTRTAEGTGGALRIDSSPAGTAVTLALGPPPA